ncbi:MAG: response regulator [Draconibacterium sp.]|nr:response regulator [Draconibacterium sp.]
MKILLVEDNLLNQKVVMFNLRKYKYDITAVINGMDAIDKFKNNTFDLILMDIMLPDLNGFEITFEIRKIEKERNIENPIPIVAITANTLDNERDKCLAAGMNDYLSKPFTAIELYEKINQFFSNK